MAALVVALPRIIIDLLIFTMIHGCDVLQGSCGYWRVVAWLYFTKWYNSFSSFPYVTLVSRWLFLMFYMLIKLVTLVSRWLFLMFYMLIKSYLDNRYQKVDWNKHYSTWDKIRCGVPQGSILGPLLFLIYVNDLPLINKDIKDHEIILYADDTSVIITVPLHMELNTQANLLFYKINTWFQNNLLFLNLEKAFYTDFLPIFQLHEWILFNTITQT